MYDSLVSGISHLRGYYFGGAFSAVGHRHNMYLSIGTHGKHTLAHGFCSLTRGERALVFVGSYGDYHAEVAVQAYGISRA